MSHVDGQNGVLIIGGYELKELAGKVTFRRPRISSGRGTFRRPRRRPS
jgi:hypothetical protein